MPDINTQLIVNLAKTTEIEVSLTNDDYNTLINHYKNDNLNQFSLYLIQKVLDKKQFTESREIILTQLTALFADIISKKPIPLNADVDEAIITLIIDLYKTLFVIDILELYSNRF